MHEIRRVVSETKKGALSQEEGLKFLYISIALQEVVHDFFERRRPTFFVGLNKSPMTRRMKAEC